MNKFIGLTLFGLYLLVPQALSQSNSKWEFRFYNSMGMSSQKRIQKQSYGPVLDNQWRLQNIVKSAAKNFRNSHEDRLAYIGEQCQGLSLREKVEMGRYLSELSNEIYDYSRLKGGENSEDIVRVEDHWNTIGDLLSLHKTATPMGVCRDMSFTVAQFLVACGVPKECVSIQSYGSVYGGHQIVQAGCEETYSINWSELYTTDAEGVTNHDLVPDLPNANIRQTIFDPETGEVVDVRQTELGHILSVVTNAQTDDPFYNPELIMLEARYSVLTLGGFHAELKRGDKLSGLKAQLELNPKEWIHLSAGLVYAKNHLDNHNQTFAGELNQDIVYVNYQGKIDIPKIELYKNNTLRVTLLNELNSRGAMAYTYSQNPYYVSQEHNIDGYVYIGSSTKLILAAKNWFLNGGFNQEYGIESKYNREVEGVTNYATLGLHGIDLYQHKKEFYAEFGASIIEGHNLSIQSQYTFMPIADSRRYSTSYEAETQSFRIELGQTKYRFHSGVEYTGYDGSIGKSYQIDSRRSVDLRLGARYNPNHSYDKYGGNLTLKLNF